MIVGDSIRVELNEHSLFRLCSSDSWIDFVHKQKQSTNYTKRTKAEINNEQDYESTAW